LINGKNYDWEDIQIFINGILYSGVTEISYSDEQEWEGQYAGGSKAVGVGRGNYKASGDITLTRNTYDILNNVARAAGKTIYDNKPGMIVVSYGAKTVPEDSDFISVDYSPLHTDTLQNFVFEKRDFSAKQNDKGNTVKLNLFIGDII